MILVIPDSALIYKVDDIAGRNIRYRVAGEAISFYLKN